MSIRFTLLVLALSLSACATLPRDNPKGRAGAASSWGITYAPCAWCGSTTGIEIHHVYPQHIRPDLARDTNNMVNMCRIDHFRIGHRGNWTNAVTNLLKMIEAGKR